MKKLKVTTVLLDDRRRQKTAKVDGGYNGGKYIKKVNNFAITCKYWWRGKDFNLRPSGYEFYVPPYYWLIPTYNN